MPEKCSPGWYGKLPVTGDFLQQRLTEHIVTGWANWFQQGLTHWHHHTAASTTEFLRAPVWNFILPLTPGVQRVQMGCLLPSCDRIGRAWPLLALCSFPLADWFPGQLALSGDWYQKLGGILLKGVRERQSPTELEANLIALTPLPTRENQQSMIVGYDDLPISLSWRGVADHFDPQKSISYWWSNRSDGYPHATHKHSGTLTAELFSLLFNPAAGAQPGRNGLYPPMFE
ncbi:hypothetical protein ED28_00320 [[Pantoea] beijingensis]|uniref:Type VI secretion system-associated protein TagF n=1 Tax=[Pantoea] beijingensis TaxID=1324864 RepID=A0A443IHG2_9GAMM|nr:type VI secretion system-associated protein TagF [[Pantoea] beijingensis]RWR03466.1 hypothetical protein ED28_00320 [[Pantoea] beijingensis]